MGGFAPKKSVRHVLYIFDLSADLLWGAGAYGPCVFPFGFASPSVFLPFRQKSTSPCLRHREEARLKIPAAEVAISAGDLPQ